MFVPVVLNFSPVSVTGYVGTPFGRADRFQYGPGLPVCECTLGTEKEHDQAKYGDKAYVARPSPPENSSIALRVPDGFPALTHEVSSWS